MSGNIGGNRGSHLKKCYFGNPRALSIVRGLLTAEQKQKLQAYGEAYQVHPASRPLHILSAMDSLMMACVQDVLSVVQKFRKYVCYFGGKEEGCAILVTHTGYTFLTWTWEGSWSPWNCAFQIKKLIWCIFWKDLGKAHWKRIFSLYSCHVKGAHVLPRRQDTGTMEISIPSWTNIPHV